MVNVHAVVDSFDGGIGLGALMVAQTIKISTAARGMFLIPNWIGVKTKLATRYVANGTAPNSGTLPRNTRTNTNPKLIRMTGHSVENFD